MESTPKPRSLLATVSEQLEELERRDWEVWVIAAGGGVAVGLGILALLFRAEFLDHGRLQLNVSISPELFFGVVALIVLFNTYVFSQRLQLRRTRKQVISNTIQSELIRLQSFTDPLTEVYNRRTLDDVARRFISQAKRLGKPLTFLMVDVDRFRDINNRFGHLIGDFVLAETATILRESVRGSDAVVRYGGDEFLAILGNSNFQGGEAVTNRIASSLEDWNKAEHLKNFELSFSVGVAEWSAGKNLDQMLNEADQAMYSTKASHKQASSHRVPPSADGPSRQTRPLVKN